MNSKKLKTDPWSIVRKDVTFAEAIATLAAHYIKQTDDMFVAGEGGLPDFEDQYDFMEEDMRHNDDSIGEILDTIHLMLQQRQAERDEE